MAKSGIVYLIGAGPGDPGLFTIKGKQVLEKAEVVVYDRLIGPEILDHAPLDAERIYVGKVSNRHALPQEDINQLLVDKALEGKIVARLKGEIPSCLDGVERKPSSCASTASLLRSFLESHRRWRFLPTPAFR